MPATRSARVWTGVELTYLELFVLAQVPRKSMAITFGRSVDAVYSKCRDLTLQGDRPKRRKYPHVDDQRRIHAIIIDTIEGGGIVVDIQRELALAGYQYHLPTIIDIIEGGVDAVTKRLLTRNRRTHRGEHMLKGKRNGRFGEDQKPHGYHPPVDPFKRPGPATHHDV